MTQPTFEPTNPTAKPSGQQGHSASAVDKSDFEKNQLSPKNKHDDQQLNRLPMMPDKAALLALFTLPSVEKRSSEMALIEQPSTNNPSAQTSATLNYLPILHYLLIKVWILIPARLMSQPSGWHFTALSISVLGYYI